jgi:hypothetical protein
MVGQIPSLDTRHIAGLNGVLRDVLSNALAGAMIRAAALRYHSRPGMQNNAGDFLVKKRRIGMAMFGVTTPGVDAIRAVLSAPPYNCEVLVFHATGHGGKVMERLVREGRLDAVLDQTWQRPNLRPCHGRRHECGPWPPRRRCRGRRPIYRVPGRLGHDKFWTTRHSTREIQREAALRA